MMTRFAKYHALLNDFIVIEAGGRRHTRSKLSAIALRLCHRRSGIGADGVLYLRGHDEYTTVDIVNSDGSHAEKSGNGLRIAVMHTYLKDRRTRQFRFEMGGQIHKAKVVGRRDGQMLVQTELGSPSFECPEVPVRSRRRYMINAPLKIGGLEFPVTCLSVGNPHTVMLVEDFKFDWHTLGAEIEKHRAFPNHTNVEFIKVLSRRRLLVADWERGAGATGSSGTGAAAAVCAGVMLGICDRRCRVKFETGHLDVDWAEDTGIIHLTGPVEKVAEGEVEL
ncbi:MAG: diaminopimelate epimerase [bacterium]